MTRFLRIASVTLAVASVSLLVATAVGDRDSSWSLLGAAWPAANILVGLLLTYRRPRLLVGWLFAAIGFLVASGGATDMLAERSLGYGDPAPWWGVASAWYGEIYWLSMIYTMLVFLPLLFPNGRAPSPRLRQATRLIVLVLGVATVIAALQEQLDTSTGRWVTNPIGFAGLGDVEEGTFGSILVVVSAASLVTAFIALFVRFRSGNSVERQQMKWFTSAAVALIIGFVVQGFIDAIARTRLEILDATLFALPPIAAAVAILRYRLYAIDRIISRTVTYALVTAMLVGVYVGAVTLISAAIDPLAGESPLAVAIATLAAAAAFRPAQRRVQAAVDRRFNRARYDVQRTVEGFRERVRSDVDLDRLCADLVAVTDEALQPATAVVWLRGDEATA